MSTKKTHKLDQATLKKLSGLFPCTNNYTVDCTPSIYDDVQEEYKPIFVLKPLSNKELKDLSKSFQNGTELSEEEATLIVKDHIVTIKNLIDISTGKTMDYSEEVFDIIPTIVQASLIQELLGISGLKTA